MQRLVSALVAPAERFQLLWGAGLTTRFGTPYGGSWDFEHALARMLRERGFGRIVFYAPQRGIYYGDHESRRLGRPQVAGGPDARNSRFSGPLGERLVINRPTIAAPMKMGDAGVMQILDHVMRDTSGPRSAVVLRSGGIVAGIFATALYRDLIASWADVPADNSNICIWASDAADQVELQAQAEQIQLAPFTEMLASPAGTHVPVQAE